MTPAASRILLALFLCVLLGACSLAPRYERPGQDLPKEWRNIDLGTTPLNTDWWTRFNDPVLTALIEEALAKNQELAESMANIESAAAQAGVGASQLFPSIDGTGSAGAESSSIRNSNQQTDYSPKTGMARAVTSYNAKLTASWEIDFWGKNRNYYTYLTDVLMKTVIGHEALRLSVAAETAETYFALLALDMQLDTARRTLKAREQSFGIYTSRYEQGDITELDWQRARAQVETARAQVHTTAVSLDKKEAALAVLIGRSPREIINRAMPRGRSVDSMPAPPVLPAGLPSEMLLRRPDIRAAEFLIMAYNANIGVARAKFFPSISLTGMLGTLSGGFLNLFTNDSGVWNYGAAINLPILDFGNNWSNLRDAEAKKKAAIAAYNKTVQDAFKDVRTALTAQREADAIVKSMKAQVGSLRRAADIAQLQYDNGYTDYLTVLDAQRELFSAELSLASALEDRLDAVVSVCKALGGGWRDNEGNTPAVPYLQTDELVRAKTGERNTVK
ncbi:MAG: efflux transporter outer membrane subunit [Desulfovibrio sp.]|nr:efflux transporter outer membrane subunit [Desulfovibrio sp.]